MKKIFLLLAALIVLGTAVLVSSCGKTSLPCSITAYNSSLESTDRLNILDTLLVGVTGLKPNDLYNLSVIDSSQTTITEARFSADENGAIPATALWYDIGARVTTEVGGTSYTEGSIDYGVTLKSYQIKITGVTDTGTDFSLPFTVINTGTVAKVWAADSSGNVKNAFLEGSAVYAYGTNFTANDAVDIYVTIDKNWTDGDSLTNLDKSGGKETVTTNANGTLAAVSVWSSAEVQSTYSAANPNPFDYSYDIVVDVDQDGIYDSSGDVVDHILYSGFVVQKPPVPHYKLQIASTGFNYSMYNAKNWGYSDSYKKDASTLLTVNGSKGIRAIWNPYVYGGNPKVSSIYGRYVDVYITTTEPTDNAAIPADVSGANSTAQVERIPVYPGCGNGCWQYIIWPGNTLTVGTYYVVIDVNCDGTYQKTTDILDGIKADDSTSNIGFKIVN